MNRMKLKGKEIWVCSYQYDDDGDRGFSTNTFEKEKDAKNLMERFWLEDHARCEVDENDEGSNWGKSEYSYWITYDYLNIECEIGRQIIQ